MKMDQATPSTLAWENYGKKPFTIGIDGIVDELRASHGLIVSSLTYLGRS